MNKLVLITVASALAMGSSAMAAQTHHGKNPANQANAQPKQRLGTLSCSVAGGAGLIIGSNKAVDCDFKRAGGRSEHYVGSIGKLGIDIGITQKSYLSWIVYNVEPTSVGTGALAGTYVGASAGASIGYGLGANALVGGTAKNFGLQPLSEESSTGLNVAAGVSRLSLKTAR